MTAAARTDPKQLQELLREVGLKVTTQRLAVLDVLTHQPHADADAVFSRVRETVPTTSIQAVYGVLSALTEARLLRRIEPAGSSALYERRTGDNHHHLICTTCRSVVDVDCVMGEPPCLTPSSSHGFVVDQAEVTFWGTCPSCRQSHQTAPRQHGQSQASTQGE